MSERQASVGDELRSLTAEHCNGTLSDEGFARLESLLLQDDANRAFFRRYLALDAGLHEYGGSAACHWQPRPAEPPAESKLDPFLWSVAGAIAILGLIGIAAFYFFPRDREVAIGALERVTGDVRLFAANGEARAIAADAPLRAGDTVRTRGAESSTTVAYPDGTRVTLLGNTSVTYGDTGAKSLVVHEGTLSALVSPQPSTLPMVLSTPLAQMEVLGTRLFVAALASRTDLSVSEGRVRLTRIRDGQAIEVPDGKQAVVTEKSNLVVQDIPNLKPAWEADFEGKLPEGWSVGEYVTVGLPPGSRGAVKTAREEHPDGSVSYVVASNEEWLSGLFKVEPKSHLHFTFKVEGTHWFNVLIPTRTSDSRDPRYSGNYIFTDFRSLTKGQWYTASVPLSLFKRIHRGDIPLTEVVPFRISFGSDLERLQLTIDRMWVTPDGDGTLNLKEAN